ncbi:MAG: hypothetical protein RIB60_04215 [Phycisphaerales bacterium]
MASVPGISAGPISLISIGLGTILAVAAPTSIVATSIRHGFSVTAGEFQFLVAILTGLLVLSIGVGLPLGGYLARRRNPIWQDACGATGFWLALTTFFAAFLAIGHWTTNGNESPVYETLSHEWDRSRQSTEFSRLSEDEQAEVIGEKMLTLWAKRTLSDRDATTEQMQLARQILDEN